MQLVIEKKYSVFKKNKPFSSRQQIFSKLYLIGIILLTLTEVDAQIPTVKSLPVFQLKKTPVYPQKIVLFRHVQNPSDLLLSKPIRLDAQKDSAEIVVDYGKEIVGKVSLYLNAENIGKNSHLKLFYGEDIKEILRTQEYTSGWYVMPKDSFQLTAGKQTLVNHGRRAFRYLKIVVPPGSGQIQLDSIAATLQHYPVNEEGYFSSSDPQLNKIWEISAYTTKLCMQ